VHSKDLPIAREKGSAAREFGSHLEGCPRERVESLACDGRRKAAVVYWARAEG
jgi:hypothetical protein